MPDSDDAGPRSSAFDQLHPKIQKWIYDRRWGHLRDVQELAATPILDGDHDVIIAAATASGKTEAAWLPICTALLVDRESQATTGVQALYIGPLKALINDQYQRLTDMSKELDITVHRWHGDVAGSRKAQLIHMPDGILLITPESLESMLVNHGNRIANILGGLRYIVIDELHAFIGTERGAQLQSLLHRLDLIAGCAIARIALSATLGDFAAAKEFLRPAGSSRVKLICSDTDGRELRLQLRGYVATDPRRQSHNADNGAADDTEDSRHQVAIADHLFQTLRGNDNLVFANRRSAVEIYTDLLAQRCKQQRVPVEFLPHHGNLSKEIREHVEERLKDHTTPITAICTSTLEMGIDIGSVDSIAQIGAPITVSSLRQRLGRSGRRPDQPAVLRIYIAETELTDSTPPADQLRAELVQTIAMIELLLQKWYEPPDLENLHLSTLIQQILSVIAQRGGAQPAALYKTLCGTGPFNRVGKDTFVALLRSMGHFELVAQSSDGLLLPGNRGDRIINHYTFYTAFHTPQEFRLVAEGTTIGTLPVDHPVAPGSLLIFGGRRWKVLSIDPDHKVIELTRSTGGKPPSFPGTGARVADEVRRKMRELYSSSQIPAYLDRTAQTLLHQGRTVYRRHGHDHQTIFGWGTDTLLFPWRGDKIMDTLAVVFAVHGYEVGRDGIALTIRGINPSGLHELVGSLANLSPSNPIELAASVQIKASDKYDAYLNKPLLDLAYAARSLDVPGAWETLHHLAGLPTPTSPASFFDATS